MQKKSYIDPITDYLLHDPEQIGTGGSLARGALTLSGAGVGGFGTHKLLQATDNILAEGKRIPKLAKLGLILGAATGLGGAGHWLGTDKFSYTPEDKLHNKLDRIAKMVTESNNTTADIADKVLSNPTNKEAIESAGPNAQSLLEQLTNLVKPKSSYEKFKDSGASLWENLKATGMHGWEALKDELPQSLKN